MLSSKKTGREVVLDTAVLEQHVLLGVEAALAETPYKVSDELA